MPGMRNQKSGEWSPRKKSRRFAELYVIDCGFNATEAYRRLYREMTGEEYTGDSHCSWEMRHKPATVQEIEKLVKAEDDSREVRRRAAIDTLERIAFDESRGAAERMRALDLINKMDGNYEQRVSLSANDIEVVIR